MADCSELSKLVDQLVSNIAAEGSAQVQNQAGETETIEIKTFDDVVDAIKKMLPQFPITREYVVDAVNEAVASRRREVSETEQRVREIRKEPQNDKKLNETLDKYQEYLETGEVSEKKAKKPASFIIEQLRKTRDNLRRWLETSDPAMQEKLENRLDELTQQVAHGNVESVRRGKLHDELQELQDEIDALREQVRDSRVKDRLRQKIAELQKHLEEGTVPESRRLTPKGDAEAQMLRETRDDIKRAIQNSPPARAQRLRETLSALEKRLSEIDDVRTRLMNGEITRAEAEAILTPPKPSRETTDELQQLEYEAHLKRKEIDDAIRNLTPITLWGRVGRGVDMARLIMTSGEFSFALRQGGVFAMSHPLKWTQTMIETFKAFGSKRALYNLNKQIQGRANAANYNRDGLVILTEGMELSRAEEVIMNYWMDKIPIFENFNRAAIAFFNKTRADMYDMGYKTLGKSGEMTAEEGAVWANYINVMTGRGNLSAFGYSFEPIALFLNRTFFSARYVASRFQFIGGGLRAPVLSVAGQNKRVYRQIVKEYIRFGMGLATILGLGLLVGADIETDPRSTNFGKLKFGNRRLDPLMGFGQTITYLSRLLTGSTKTQRGDIRPLRESNVFFIDDKFFSKDAKRQYGGQDILDTMSRFARSKLSPQMGIAVNALTGETYLGEEVTLLNQTTQLSYPMAYRDIWDVMQEEGMPTNVALSVLVLLGMGLNTYETDSNWESLL